uniref:PARG catalytic Macro domain-containing protein n=1 Tax=viral metagenome TaxID=1070528 RepID=A0A6C0J9M7_9ZZZZ
MMLADNPFDYKQKKSTSCCKNVAPTTTLLSHLDRSNSKTTKNLKTNICGIFNNYNNICKSKNIIISRYTLNDSKLFDVHKTHIIDTQTNTNTKKGDMFLCNADIIMNFANKYIGFSTGTTQEEILFTVFPELVPIAYINSMLEKRQSLVVTNLFNVKLDKLQTILCVDAFNARANRITDYNFNCLKFVSGLENLKFVLKKKDLTISTGAWGCGAFGNDIEVMKKIQFYFAKMFEIKLYYHIY